MSVIIKNPLMQYHPIRFYEVRKDFIEKPLNFLLSSYRTAINPTFDTYNNIENMARQIFFNSEIEQIPLSKSKEVFPLYARELYNLNKYYSATNNELGIQKLKSFFDGFTNEDYTTFETYSLFVHSGSNIFDFSSELLDFFDATNVDNVLLKDICLPFNTIYLHFGRRQDKRVNGNIAPITELIRNRDPKAGFDEIYFLLDGAYINHCSDTNTLNILLTGIKNKANKYTNNCIDCYEDALTLKLSQDSTNTSIKDAVTRERERLLLMFREMKNYYKDDKCEFPKLSNDASFNQSIDEIVDCLNLIINCILYLQSYPDDVEEDYNPEAPSNLVEQSKRAPGAAAAAQKKLNQLGYKKIKFCGRKRQKFWQLSDEDLSEPDSIAAIQSESQRNMAPHKRRAHLRKQRYGKELQSWRYIWIKETTVHKDKYEQVLAPAQWRIYEVTD